MGRFGRLSCGVIIAFALSLLGGEVRALDLRDCDRPQIDPTLIVAACTKIIDTANSNQVLSAAYSNRGLAHARSGNWEAAMADQNAAIAADPRAIAGWANRASLWIDRNEFDRAISDYDQCIRVKPNFATCYLNRGTIWFRLRQYDRAIADHTIAIGLDPRDWTSFNNRSNDWKEKGDYQHALEDINRAIQVEPNEALTFSTRGELYRLMGDLDRAMTDQNKAMSLIPPNTPIQQSPLSLMLLRRGDIWRYRGEFQRALADYNEGLRYPGYTAWIYTSRGITYERMDNLTRARADFVKALSLPEFNWDGSQDAHVTARARLAAIDSGAAQPSILPAPVKAASQESVPTQAAAIPTAQTISVAQGRRVALVIGNSTYTKVPALPNPQKDAEAVAASLRNIGFETVTLRSNATREELIGVLRAFADEADKADWAMVYYAGHGVEVNGQNYLIPIDATLKTDRDVQFETIALDQVMNTIDGARKLKLVVLDACRDNPFAPKMQRTGARDAVAAGSTAGGTVGTRSIGRGLGEVKVTGASLVVFAAKHGQTALDGEGANSPFAVALVQRIATPGVEINKIFRLVRDDVMEATAGRQEPYTYGSLPGKEDFYFVAAK
jgi:tetratricopeptide (TPR) repeat protein